MDSPNRDHICGSSAFAATTTWACYKQIWLRSGGYQGRYVTAVFLLYGSLVGSLRLPGNLRCVTAN
jgi:hypothetical protein